MSTTTERSRRCRERRKSGGLVIDRIVVRDGVGLIEMLEGMELLPSRKDHTKEQIRDAVEKFIPQAVAIMTAIINEEKF